MYTNRELGYELFLAHHGIKGMHWGVRRYQDYGEGGYTPKDGKGHKKDSLKEKDIHAMLSKETKSFDSVKRLEEEQYKAGKAINEKYKRKGHDVTSRDFWHSKEGHKYFKEHDKVDKKYDKKILKAMSKQHQEEVNLIDKTFFKNKENRKAISDLKKQYDSMINHVGINSKEQKEYKQKRQALAKKVCGSLADKKLSSINGRKDLNTTYRKEAEKLIDDLAGSFYEEFVK